MPPLISRGFRGRRGDAPAGRVPAGQYVTPRFSPSSPPGPTPHTPLDRWDFSIVGEVNQPRRWTWEEFRALPARGGDSQHPLRDQVVEARHRSGRESPLNTLLDGDRDLGRAT